MANRKSNPGADLDITKTYSRPHVSDGNPYSESHFRTLKYRPGFPERFGSLQAAPSFSQEFFAWYNDEHRHSGLGLLSLAVVHHVKLRRPLSGGAPFSMPPTVLIPNASSAKPPQPLPAPKQVWINKPQPTQENKTQ